MPRPRKRKLPKHIRAHGSKFRVVIAAGGDIHRSPVMATVEQAVVYRDAYLKARESSVTGPLRLTLQEGLDMVLDDCRLTDARPATLTFYSNHSRPLFAGLGGGDRKMDEVTPDEVRRYLGDRLAAGVKANTIVNKELFLLRRMLKLARERGVPIAGDPFLGVRMPKIRRERYKHLTKKQVHDVLAALRAAKRLGPWFADVVDLLFATGMRRAELVRLRVQDIDFARGYLRVRGKTGDRHQTFATELEPVLRRLITAAQPNGHIVKSEDQVEKAFDRWRRKLGLDHFSAHVMRHSYGTAIAYLRKADGSYAFGLLQAMAMMDHKDPKETAIYFHARGDDVREALGALQHDEQSQLHHPPDAESTSSS